MVQLLKFFIQTVLIYSSLKLTAASSGSKGINHIEIKGKHFIDETTGEPFLLKGLAYQPGGSADITEEKDPLSDPETCLRDIQLFRELGVNTIRVYSVNPDLNHDYCMTLLAMSGIYLILDVNSPLPNQHLNRYEPWKSYNTLYLEHVFKVVKQFSAYDNTLAFFAGNEVVNDYKSSRLSPRYIKKLIGDIKQFTEKHCSRAVPIGYSAADDLNYRVSLSNYLACHNNTTPSQIVDFYGVNSYQWCGEQTLHSSGYDLLIKAYKDYSKPVILSEFGCNKVLPRKFGETTGLFSTDMVSVFSGGLAYEYSQELNNYGLVEIMDEGDVNLLSDFYELKDRYKAIDLAHLHSGITDDIIDDTKCQETYDNLNIDINIAEDISDELIKSGVNVTMGKYITIDVEKIHCNYTVYGVDGRHWEQGISWDNLNDLTQEKSSSQPSKEKEPNKNSSHLKKNSTISIHSFDHFDILVIFLPLWLVLSLD